MGVSFIPSTEGLKMKIFSVHQRQKERQREGEREREQNHLRGPLPMSPPRGAVEKELERFCVAVLENWGCTRLNCVP